MFGVFLQLFIYLFNEPLSIYCQPVSPSIAHPYYYLSTPTKKVGFAFLSSEEEPKILLREKNDVNSIFLVEILQFSLNSKVNSCGMLFYSHKKNSYQPS